IWAADRRNRGAVWVGADVSDIPRRRLSGRHRKRGYVGHVICAGIVAVEQIEELDKRRRSTLLTKSEWPAHAQIGLYVGSSAELIQYSWRSVDCYPFAI